MADIFLLRSPLSDLVNTRKSPDQRRPFSEHTEDQDVPTAFGTVLFVLS